MRRCVPERIICEKCHNNSRVSCDEICTPPPDYFVSRGQFFTHFSQIKSWQLSLDLFCAAFESISCPRPHCLSIWRGTPMETQRPGINLAKDWIIIFGASLGPNGYHSLAAVEIIFASFLLCRGRSTFAWLWLFTSWAEQIHSPLITITRKCMQLHATLTATWNGVCRR